VVLISGSGSNLQAIIDAAQSGEIPVEIRAVISNRADIKGLERAQQAGINTRVIEHTLYPDRTSFDVALQQCIDSYTPGLVVLAGFMRILTSEFVQHYHGRMMNIHPSLLPRFRGLNTHARALEEGVEQHGASVHFVTDELDGGPLVLQAIVPVHNDDNKDSLAARVLEQEHRIYPLAIGWYAEGRLRLVDSTPFFDGKPLQQPCRLHSDSGVLELCTQ
jgi:phosphoribosylglycinamide formyltransferase-1